GIELPGGRESRRSKQWHRKRQHRRIQALPESLILNVILTSNRIHHNITSTTSHKGKRDWSATRLGPFSLEIAFGIFPSHHKAQKITPCPGSVTKLKRGACWYAGEREKQNFDRTEARSTLSSVITKCWPTQIRGPVPNGIISPSRGLSPQISSTSARARACQYGCAASNIKLHDAAMAVVSWPAKNIVLQLSTMNFFCDRPLESPAPARSIWNKSSSPEASIRCFTSFNIIDSASFSNLHQSVTMVQEQTFISDK
ncbi:cytochrome P450, family 714, subfamily A, polypeptide 1, partial [Prunus dulcis]